MLNFKDETRASREAKRQAAVAAREAAAAERRKAEAAEAKQQAAAAAAAERRQAADTIRITVTCNFAQSWSRALSILCRLV
jgi:hypothetical protein